MPSSKSEPSGGCFFALVPPIVAALLMLLLSLIVQSSQNQPATLAPSNSQLAPFFTPEVTRWEAQILSWGETYQLDPNLIATVMQIESCGNPQAVSPAGATGLFQVMPYHFEENENPFDPETNARRGLTYLRQALTDSQGDIAAALAGYNGGLGVIGLGAAFWPEESQRYAYWGAQIYADAQAGQSVSPRLEEWLAHGGNSLCRQARLSPGP